MSKFEEALCLHLEEWGEQLDQELKEAEARGELPNKSEEQLRAEANAIWQKAQEQEL